MTSRFRNVILMAVAVLAIWIRTPQLIAEPRFWAEEGSRYFQYALTNGFWSTLLFLDPRAGYLDITRHLASGLASLVPLEYAPYITTFIAYFLQLLACYLVVCGRSKIFDSYTKKCLGCIVILFSPTVIDEVWLNTINSMTWYGLIGFLIAVERLSLLSAGKVLGYRVILGIGAVSGPYVCMLAPVFALVALQDRTRNTVINAGIVFGGLVVHSVVLCYFLLSGEINEKRFSGSDVIDTSYAIFWNHLAKPIIGSDLVSKLAQIPFGLTAFLVLFIIISLVAIRYVYVRCIPFWENNWEVVFSWVCFSAGTTLTSYGHTPAGRYAVLPGWMALFLLLNCSRLGRMRLVGLLSIGLLILALGIGLINYSLGGRTQCDGRNWRTDSTLGRDLNEKVVAICPEGWNIVLPPIQKQN